MRWHARSATHKLSEISSKNIVVLGDQTGAEQDKADSVYLGKIHGSLDTEKLFHFRRIVEQQFTISSCSQ